MTKTIELEFFCAHSITALSISCEETSLSRTWESQLAVICMYYSDSPRRTVQAAPVAHGCGVVRLNHNYERSLSFLESNVTDVTANDAKQSQPIASS